MELPHHTLFFLSVLTCYKKNADDIILFIDEVHTLVGSGTVGRGNKGSGLDISNLLKPSLGRGELQVLVMFLVVLQPVILCYL